MKRMNIKKKYLVQSVLWMMVVRHFVQYSRIGSKSMKKAVQKLDALYVIVPFLWQQQVDLLLPSMIVACSTQLLSVSTIVSLNQKIANSKLFQIQILFIVSPLQKDHIHKVSYVCLVLWWKKKWSQLKSFVSWNM